MASDTDALQFLRRGDHDSRLAWFPLVAEAEGQGRRPAGVGILLEIELSMFEEPVDRPDVMPVKPDVPFVLREVTIRDARIFLNDDFAMGEKVVADLGKIVR